MEQSVLEATTRIAAGKGAARATRREGLIPGVVYGLGHAPINLSVDRDALKKALKEGGGANVLFDLRIAGVEPLEGVAALVKSMQRHPISRIPESVDFHWVSLADMIQVSVPVVMEGTSQAVKDGATIDLQTYEVLVECLPGTIPQKLVVSVEGIGFHEVRTVADLQVPPGVTVLLDADTVIAACLLPTAEEEPREGAAVEGEVTTVDAV